MSRSTGGTGLAAVVVIIALAVAAGNLLLFAAALQHLSGGAPGMSPFEAVRAVAERAPAYLVYLASAHVLAGVLLALVFRFFRPPAGEPITQPQPQAAAADPAAPGLRLLALLQSEGRLIDFLEEDIDAYSDSQVGAAVRSIHAGCRKALRERMRIDRIYAADDGTEVEVAAGYDPAAVRLTGNVHGQPPFRGTLQHSGWRVTNVQLPQAIGGPDVSILAPAEIEIP